MRRVLKRIAVHGLLTAGVLAILGYGFAELATIWLAGQPTGRATPDAPPAAVDPEFNESLRYRLPITMALVGFAFIALVELALYLWRGEPPVPAKKPAQTQPDPAELLLEEILAQVEAKNQQSQNQPAAAGPSQPSPPSPLPPIGENSPTLPGGPRA